MYRRSFSNSSGLSKDRIMSRGTLSVPSAIHGGASEDVSSVAFGFTFSEPILSCSMPIPPAAIPAVRRMEYANMALATGVDQAVWAGW